MKVRFRLVVDESNLPLLTGGRCSEVAVKAGLTVFLKNSTLIGFGIILWFNFECLNMPIKTNSTQNVNNL